MFGQNRRRSRLCLFEQDLCNSSSSHSCTHTQKHGEGKNSREKKKIEMYSGQEFAGRAELGLGQGGLGFLRAEGCGLGPG